MSRLYDLNIDDSEGLTNQRGGGGVFRIFQWNIKTKEQQTILRTIGPLEFLRIFRLIGKLHTSWLIIARKPGESCSPQTFLGFHYRGLW